MGYCSRENRRLLQHARNPIQGTTATGSAAVPGWSTTERTECHETGASWRLSISSGKQTIHRRTAGPGTSQCVYTSPTGWKTCGSHGCYALFSENQGALDSDALQPTARNGPRRRSEMAGGHEKQICTGSDRHVSRNGTDEKARCLPCGSDREGDPLKRTGNDPMAAQEGPIGEATSRG